MYPMPILEELFDSIGDSNIFTIVDMRQNFNQIMFTTKDRKKTTFHGSNKLWEWLVMPFGLKNAHIFFQRIMDQVLEGAYFLKCYINDVLVHSKGLRSFIELCNYYKIYVQDFSIIAHPLYALLKKDVA